MNSRLELHVQRFIRMGTSTILERVYNPNILGAVNLVSYVAGKKMYVLEPGAYKVEFKEIIPFMVNDVVAAQLLQPRLFDAGAHLTINLFPFCGILNVEYKVVLEDNLTIAVLMWDNVLSNIPITDVSIDEIGV